MSSLRQGRVVLDRAVFVISLDTELAWGSFDRGGVHAFWHEYSQVRDAVKRLLELFHRYTIKATWAIVGHLFLKSCSKTGLTSHKHVLQPEYSWFPQGRLSQDPHSNFKKDPFFYAPDVVERILASQPRHEIASHTFTHAILGDPECTREVACSQLKECKRLAMAKGIDMVSLVFPRNSVGHLDALCELGFSSYRGPQQGWSQHLDSFPRLGKLCRYADKAAALTPPCYKELRWFQMDGQERRLFELPASMFYPPFGGLWNLIGLSQRVKQARKGIDAAVKKKALFHLWFHPFNLASSPLLFEGLEEVLSLVRGQVDAGNMDTLTMAETASHLSSLLDRHT